MDNLDIGTFARWHLFDFLMQDLDTRICSGCLLMCLTAVSPQRLSNIHGPEIREFRLLKHEFVRHSTGIETRATAWMPPMRALE
jgi:hypothetical protein